MAWLENVEGLGLWLYAGLGFVVVIKAEFYFNLPPLGVIYGPISRTVQFALCDPPLLMIR